VLLVAVYYRTNLTVRQIAPLFGISKSAAGRVIDHLALMQSSLRALGRSLADPHPRVSLALRRRVPGRR
jgi:hypothetical protein